MRMIQLQQSLVKLVSTRPVVSIGGVEVLLLMRSRSPRDAHQHPQIAAEHCEPGEHHRSSMHLENCNISTCCLDRNAVCAFTATLDIPSLNLFPCILKEPEIFQAARDS